jgi:hypothetical protein
MDPKAYSTTMNAMSGAFSDYFQGNPVAKFVFQFIVIGLLGFITQKLPYVQAWLYIQLQSFFVEAADDRPQLNLKAIDVIRFSCFHSSMFLCVTPKVLIFSKTSIFFFK